MGLHALRSSYLDSKWPANPSKEAKSEGDEDGRAHMQRMGFFWQLNPEEGNDGVPASTASLGSQPSGNRRGDWVYATWKVLVTRLVDPGHHYPLRTCWDDERKQKQRHSHMQSSNSLRITVWSEMSLSSENMSGDIFQSTWRAVKLPGVDGEGGIEIG